MHVKKIKLDWAAWRLALVTLLRHVYFAPKRIPMFFSKVHVLATIIWALSLAILMYGSGFHEEVVGSGIQEILFPLMGMNIFFTIAWTCWWLWWLFRLIFPQKERVKETDFKPNITLMVGLGITFCVLGVEACVFWAGGRLDAVYTLLIALGVNFVALLAMCRIVTRQLKDTLP